MRTKLMIGIFVFEGLLLLGVLPAVGTGNQTIPEIRVTLGILGLIGLLVGALGSIVVARRITRPIDDLVRCADAISNREFENTIQVRTNDEIGYLGKRFSMMQKMLKEHIQLLTENHINLKKSNEQLEWEIVERTRIEKELERNRDCLEEEVSKRTELLEMANNRLEHEIEDRKRAENIAIEAQRKAEAASLAKNRFLAGVSYEIRTPLNGVLGMGDLISRTELSEQQRRYVDIIQHSGQSLLEIINDILDLSKIEAGKLELEMAGFELNGVIESVVGLMIKPAHDKGLTLTCHRADDLPHTVWGDEVHLRRILMNIVGNAIKFTEKGEVTIRVSTINNPGQRVLLGFEVSDTGIGIESGIQARIFDSFTQATYATTHNYEGVGLGLAISKQLVEKMGGEIGVESTLGKGSTFRFTVWLGVLSDRVETGSATESKDREDAREMKTTYQARILLSEDNPTNQTVALAMLETLGCRVDVARNGKEAFDAFSNASYDLIFMDCHMPVMDGFEAVKAIRQMEDGNPGTHIPIVALTADALTGTQKRCIAAGMDDYLSKPFSYEQFSAVLSKWLTQKNRQEGITGPVSEPDKESDSSAAEPESDGPIDYRFMESLRELEDQGAAGLVEDLIVTYLDISPEYLRKLGDAVSRDDVNQWHETAQSFKTSNTVIRAMGLIALCQEAEEMGRRKRTGNAATVLAAIEKEYGRVEEALRHYMARSGDER